MGTRISLIPNLNCETIKNTKIQHVKNKNPIGFYCQKVMTKKHIQICVEKIKGDEIFYLYLYPLGT
jgi:hypothetical protein